jgi:Effector Associated Constant Component 1
VTRHTALAISFDGDVVADELRSLRAYLLDEPALRGLVSLRRPALDRDALAGGVPDAVLVALGDGSPMTGSIRTLSLAIARWFEARRTAPRLRVTGPDGRAVDLDGSATGVDQLSAFLEEA